MPTDNRFIKVDGEFQRPGVFKGGEMMPVFGTPEYDALVGNRTLSGITSNTPTSPLPSANPNATVSTSVNPLAGTGNVSQASPDFMADFNAGLKSMLEKAKGLTTADYIAKKMELERRQSGAISEFNPDTVGYSADVQDSIRKANAGKYKPEIDQNAYEMEKAQQSIDNFFKVYGEAKAFGKDFADKMVAPDSVIENARHVIEADPDKLATVLAQFNDKSKEKIIGTLDYNKLHQKVKTTQVDLGDRVALVDDQGNVVKYISKGINPKDVVPEITPEKALTQISLVENSIANAKKLADASGRSGVRKFVEGNLVGATDYTNLVAETNTLRTNVLTMMTDPSIKKFFGPQMSNADVQLMTSAGTTLNPELQNPEKMKSELTRLEDLVKRAKASVQQGGSSASPAKGVDGTAYGFPGYISDGTQWIKK